MNDRETSELRRRLQPDKHNITNICGCYVNDHGDMISTFTVPFYSLTSEEEEKYLAIFRRTMSGVSEKNLLSLSFSNEQVLNGKEHHLLSALKSSELHDVEAVLQLYEQVISGYHTEGNYLILLMHNIYEIPYHAKDGSKSEGQGDQFSYILCSICPVKLSKPALSYDHSENMFHSRKDDQIVAMPTNGFLFPTFDDRRTNIYSTLYYTKNTANIQEGLIACLFAVDSPMTPAEQKARFGEVLGETLGEACSLDVVQTVHREIGEMVQAHKESRVPEPLTVSKRDVTTVLTGCALPEETIKAFGDAFDAVYGKAAELTPENLMDIKRFEVRTPQAMIRVSADSTETIETRVIDGVKYIMIRADESVEINGVPVRIAPPSAGSTD